MQSRKDIKINVSKQPMYIESVSASEFAESVGMAGWIEESIYLPESDCSLDSMKISAESLLEDQYNSLIKSSEFYLKSMFVRHMGSVGYGVFATDAIPANQFIAVYTGIITCHSHDHLREANNEYGFKIPNENEKYGVLLNAKHYGNISRFIQHLPLDAKETKTNDVPISNYVVSPSVRVATANLSAEVVCYQKLPVLVLRTTRKINPFEQLGYDYGINYWKNHTPSLFDTIGKSISFSDYYVKEPRVRFTYYDKQGDRIDVNILQLTYKKIVQCAEKGFVIGSSGIMSAKAVKAALKDKSERDVYFHINDCDDHELKNDEKIWDDKCVDKTVLTALKPSGTGVALGVLMDVMFFKKKSSSAKLNREMSHQLKQQVEVLEKIEMKK